MMMGDRVTVERHGERYAGDIVGLVTSSGKRRVIVHRDGTAYMSGQIVSERYVSLDASDKSA